MSRANRRARRSLMPVIILVVAFVIFLVVKLNQRQYLVDLSGRVDQMITDLCSGTPLETVRWSDKAVQESVVNSVERLCASPAESRTVAAMVDYEDDDKPIEIRIAVDSQNVMTLWVKDMPDGLLLVQGWSSE